ncbi:hypothetical protein BC830DRAFT_558621 [Chytriomyces sp. MP71]|nr:hypothetical protein BC830DRAFT_558621 [Chytriomyces sp. MP71]
MRPVLFSRPVAPSLGRKRNGNVQIQSKRLTGFNSTVGDLVCDFLATIAAVGILIKTGSYKLSFQELSKLNRILAWNIRMVRASGKAWGLGPPTLRFSQVSERPCASASRPLHPHGSATPPRYQLIEQTQGKLLTVVCAVDGSLRWLLFDEMPSFAKITPRTLPLNEGTTSLIAALYL